MGSWGRGMVCVGCASEAVLNSTGCIFFGHWQYLLHTCFNQWRKISSRLHISKCVLCVLSQFNHARLFVTLWAVARQIPLSIGSFKQECWSGLPCPSPGDLPDSAIEPSQLSNPGFLHFLHSEMSFFFLISWRLITLQCCSGFCHTLTWISLGYTCIPHPNPPSHLPLYPIPLGLPSAPGLSTCLMHPTWAGDLFHSR